MTITARTKGDHSDQHRTDAYDTHAIRSFSRTVRSASRRCVRIDTPHQAATGHDMNRDRRNLDAPTRHTTISEKSHAMQPKNTRNHEACTRHMGGASADHIDANCCVTFGSIAIKATLNS